MTGTGASVSVPANNTVVRITKTTTPFNSFNVYLYRPSSANTYTVPINAKYYVFDTNSNSIL